MARAKVISQLVAGSQPSLSVTGRADGGGYTVTAGARSLSITAEAGATLLTTVKDQDNASITVTDSTTTTPSWTAPGGGTTGADYCVQVTATKGGLTEQVSFSELVDGSGGGGGSGSLVSMIDISGVSSYNFLTTGGSGGSGGTGPHTVGGLTWTLSYPSGGAPTRLEIVSGVLYHEGSGANRALLVIDSGVDLSQRPWVVYCSIANAARTSYSPCGLYASESTSINGGNQAQLLPGDSSVTSFLQRENTTSSPAFTTVNSATLTDITTTPTRYGMHVAGGAWAPSWDQGSAILPTDGTRLGSGGNMWMESGGASAGQDRRYVMLNLFENCDVRVASYILELAP